MNLPQGAAAVNARETHPDSLQPTKVQKINDTNEALEATSNPTSAEDEVTQHEAYRRTLTTQYGEAIYDTKADKARNSEILRTKGLKSSENYEWIEENIPLQGRVETGLSKERGGKE